MFYLNIFTDKSNGASMVRGRRTLLVTDLLLYLQMMKRAKELFGISFPCPVQEDSTLLN